MARNLFRLFLGAIAVTLLPVAGARADNIYATIRGTVTDASGAVVGAVRVTATNTATGVSYTATSEANGTYQFLQLPAPGTYDVKAEQEGFRSFEASGIPLQLNQDYALDITLAVGAITQNVTVQAAPTQVETTSMQLGLHINSNAVEQLPLNGRNWVQLQQTLPGVVASSDRFGSNYSTNGSRSQANGYLVNGTDANEILLNTPLEIPSPDAIAEVNVVTNTINPEYGRNSGAVLNAVTKSGTNAFHGDGFEFYRDNALNTPNFFPMARTPSFTRTSLAGPSAAPSGKTRPSSLAPIRAPAGARLMSTAGATRPCSLRRNATGPSRTSPPPQISRRCRWSAITVRPTRRERRIPRFSPRVRYRRWTLTLSRWAL